MKDKKSIGSFLFKNYIIIFVIAIITLFLAQGIANYILNTFIYNNMKDEVYHPEFFEEYSYEDIDIEQLNITHSWIEVLDENKKVINVRGNKQDDIYQYDERKLYDYSAQHDYNEQYPFYYNIYPLDGPDGKLYLILWKLPKKMYSETYNLKIEYLFNEFNSFHMTLYGIYIGVFLILFCLSLYIYSKFTSKYFKTPLNQLVKGIREMEKQNYGTRLNFSAQKEFGEIRDAFNKMAIKLEKTEKENRILTESKQKMLVDISHDLKTPMTSIYGFSKLLYDQETISDVDKKKYLKYIYNKSLYVSDLIQNLFQLAKLDDKSFRLSYTRSDITEWLRQAVSEFYPEFERKGFEVEINISAEPIITDYDKNYMNRALTNILSNIIKYNQTGTQVYIGCYREQGKLIIKIGDNGIGIDKELKNTIFESFVRGDKSRKSEEGTGLGLSITKKIVEKHCGTITLSADKKYITLFTIQLPINGAG